MYGLDQSSGVFRPLYTSDFGTSLNITGGITASINAISITGTNSGSYLGSIDVAHTYMPVSGVGLFATSGISQANVTNTAPIPISGVVQASITPAAIQAVSGFVNVANTAPINISGIVLTQVTGSITTQVNSVAVTGFSSTIAPLAVSGALSVAAAPIQAISGFVQNLTEAALLTTTNQLLSGVSGQLSTNLAGAAWTTGQQSITNPVLAISGIVTTAPAALQAVSGNVTVTNAVLTDQITGWNTGIVVSIQPVTKTSVSNLFPTGIAPWTGMDPAIYTQTGTLFAANPNRVMFFIQNVHSGIPLYVALSQNAASTGNFSFILNPSQSQGFGGSSFSDDHYRGAVTASGGAWIHWEV